MITLRRPNFGNEETIQLFGIARKTLGQELKTFRDTLWPQTTQLQFDFEALSLTQVNDLITFYTNNLGIEITYTDYEGVDWSGFITNPSLIIVNNGATEASCKYSVKVTFEGYRV